MSSLILLVDDEPLGRAALEALLLDEDYTLAFAADGATALAQAQALAPDLILLDVMMPGMDGYEVCRRLRADARLADVPVVMVTALDDREARLRGLEAGADDFVTKPVDRMELRARVRTITRLNRYRHLQDERAKLERQLRRLSGLQAIDLAIVGSLDLQVSLGVVVQQTIAQLGVAAAAVWLLNPITHMLQYASGRGFPTQDLERRPVRLGEGPTGRVALERLTLVVPNLAAAAEAAGRVETLPANAFVGYCGVPLLAKGQVIGVLGVFQRTVLTPDMEWLEYLETLARQAAIAVDNARLFEGLQRSQTELILAYDATIEGWSRALDLRDKETEGHSQRVTTMTLRLARAVGIDDAQLTHVRRGALLHDIGKLGVPDSILLKPGPLTDEEWAIMRQHPVYAYDLLYPIAYLRPALDIPRWHHERWDGTGYPHGLKAEQIPLAARLFAVADVVDALRSDRPYRPAWSEARVREHIRTAAGSHFDPQAVQAFLSLGDA